MKNFIEFLKLPNYILLAVAIGCGFVLFAPENLLKLFLVLKLKEKYGFIVGSIFLASVALLIVSLLRSVYKKISGKFELYQLKKSQIKLLMMLNGPHVELIKTLLGYTNRTAKLPMQNAIVIELQHYDVISPAGTSHIVSMNSPQINYFLQPWVVERIKENKMLQKKYYR